MSLFPSKSDEVDKKCTGTKIPPRRGYGERNFQKKIDNDSYNASACSYVKKNVKKLF